jgi:peptidoglycan/LPS O-acetylase OafA/YrhL
VNVEAADPPATTHRDNFDGMRLVASLAVLWSHAFLLTGRSEPMLPGGLRSPGHLAVLVFFAMSGYLVFGSWARDGSVFRFAQRRFLRIWPAYAVNVIVCGLVAWWYAKDDLDLMGAQWWFTRLFFRDVDLQPFGPTVRHELNGSLWTIRYEMACYVLLAAGGWALGRRLRWAALAGLALLLLVFARQGGQAGLDGALLDWGNFPHLPYFGAFFLCGGLLFHFDPRQRAVPVLVGAGMLCVVLGQPELGSLLILPAASVWIGRRSWPVLRAAARWGDLSFGIYLWAWPAQQVAVVALGRDAPLALHLALALALVLPAAALSWYLVERPALSLKPTRSRVSPGLP